VKHDNITDVATYRSNYSAELGGASGAFINIVSKSGSNVPHGSLYGFFRNDAMDARDPFAFSSALAKGQAFDPALPDSVAPAVKNSLNREQFGGTVGFPIRKDKTFLFGFFRRLATRLTECRSSSDLHFDLSADCGPERHHLRPSQFR